MVFELQRQYTTMELAVHTMIFFRQYIGESITYKNDFRALRIGLLIFN